MIVAFESCDASGKATQSTLLAERLGAERIAFPDYKTTAGEAILRLLKEEWQCLEDADTDNEEFYKWRPSESLNALVLQSLMTTNRLELLPQINEHIKAGKHLVFDRYYASGIVYGTLDGLEREWIERIQAPLSQPDIWIMLDIPPEESVKRRPERRDRYEKMPGFQEKVRDGYLKLFEEKRALGEKWVVVDGMGTIEEVSNRINYIVDTLRATIKEAKRAPIIYGGIHLCDHRTVEGGAKCGERAYFFVDNNQKSCFKHLPE